MAGVAREEILTENKLNLFIASDGILTEAYEVGCQVFDISSGRPGTQVFPSVADTWEDQTSNAFSTGHYYVYDGSESAGWEVPVGENLRRHLVKWRWKVASTDTYQYAEQEIDVVSANLGDYDTILSIQDIRDAGIGSSDADDLAVLTKIIFVEELFERVTRQWFKPKVMDFRFDGTGTDVLLLGVPPIGIELLRLNDATTDLATTYYKVYGAPTAAGDKRRNPHLKLVRSDLQRDIYTSNRDYGVRRFDRGMQNNRLKGVFGFLEKHNAPFPVREALKRLVVEQLRTALVGDPSITAPIALPGGVVLEEETDDHRIRYTDAHMSDRRSGLSGITQDRFVLDVIQLYRAPIGVVSTAEWTY